MSSLKINPHPNSLNSNMNSIGRGTAFTSARVKRIILDNKTYPELFKKYGSWNSIGVILYEDINNPLTQDDSRYIENYAYPLFSNIKQYPLENEIVCLIQLPSPSIQSNTNNLITYYFNPINVWNSIHHNAIPNNVFSSDQKKDYIQTENGSVRRISDNSTEIDLGNTFNEKTDIKPLLPYEGDIIYEGRWGNSIRLGSTVNNAVNANIWSISGKNGDPIIILRNGQFNNNTDSWIPILEDINLDKSNIYITSTQNIPINVSSNNYKSYNTAPTNPKEYSNSSQVIISSGRLLFNSTLDHILLSSTKSINLNAVDSLNFDSAKSIFNSSKIYLGDKKATEPLLLGNKTISSWKLILTSLKEVANILPTIVPANPPLASAAAKLVAILEQEIPKLESLKSKQNYTL